jgi:hypothetical protein
LYTHGGTWKENHHGSDTKVRSAKPEDNANPLSDGDGLFLLVHANGSKYWRFRFRFGGKQHVMAFGVYPEVSLADARRKGRRPEAGGCWYRSPRT